MILLQQTPLLELPKATWVGTFFGDASDRQSIVGRAALSGYGDLRKHLLPKHNEEVRVWGGFGLTYLQATIFRKKDGVWTATRLLSALPNTSRKDWTKVYAQPKSGWPTFWKKAEELGVWTLPDDSTIALAPGRGTLDGFSYVVELQRDGRYRTYTYMNPNVLPVGPEARSMIDLDRLIQAEFPRPKL